MPARASRARLAPIALLILAAFLAACGDAPIQPPPTPVTGTGDVVAEDRTDGPFDRISVAAPVTVQIQTGDATSVTLHAQADVMPFVKTETVDGQLIVNVPAPGYVTTAPVTLVIVTPTVSSVAMSGGATGTLDVTAGALKVDLSANAQLTGTGRADSISLVQSSDGVADFRSLAAGSVNVDMVGGSAATLTVERSLTGKADGGSTITLTQEPETVQVTTVNGGSIVRG